MKRISAVFPALFLVAALLFVALVFTRTPPPLRSDDELRIFPAQGEQLGPLMNPGPDGGGSGFRLEGGEIRETFGVFRYLGPAGAPRVVIELHHRDTVLSPARQTEKFSLRVVSGAPPEPLLDALAAKLRAGESTWQWTEAAGPSTPRTAFLRRLPNLQLPITWFLLAQAPLWVALAYRRAFIVLRTLTPGQRGALLGAIAAAALARLVLAPLRLVMLYVGYQLTAQSIALQPIPRYGAGVLAFHHLLLRTFAADHRTILVTHALLGVLAIPLFAALIHTYLQSARTTILTAFLVALTPAFIAHDNSEAVTVPILFALISGLLLFTEALEERRPVALTGAAALLTYAMIGRPEIPVLAPIAALLLGIGLSPAGLRWALPRLALLVPAVAVLLGPHLVHILESAAMMQAQDSLPMGHYTTSFIRVSVLDPRLYPALLWPFAALACLPLFPARPGEGRPRYRSNLLLVLIAAADFGLTSVDLDPANILRVQIPGALFAAPVAASGLDAAWSWLRFRTGQPGKLHGRFRPLAAGVLAALLLATVPCLGASFRRTNEDEEEAFVRAARAALPPGDHPLIRLGYGDLEGASTGGTVHLHFPDYLFSPPGQPKQTRDITEWMKDPTLRGAYFYLGVRCFTPERSFDDQPGGLAPEVVPMRRACREIVERYGDGSLIEREAPNHGDPVGTSYYGTDTRTPMHLALVKLRATSTP